MPVADWNAYYAKNGDKIKKQRKERRKKKKPTEKQKFSRRCWWAGLTKKQREKALKKRRDYYHKNKKPRPYTEQDKEKRATRHKEKWARDKQQLIEDTFERLMDKAEGLTNIPIPNEEPQVLPRIRDKRSKHEWDLVFGEKPSKGKRRTGEKKIVLHEFNGEKKTLPEWCRILNLDPVVMKGRIYHQKLPPEIAFTKPHRYGTDRTNHPGKTYGRKPTGSRGSNNRTASRSN